MPSPSKSSIDIPIQFGGRVTQYDPQNLPNGASPFNHDVVFSGDNPGGKGLTAGFGTRPGNAAFYAAPFVGNPSVNFMDDFQDNLSAFHLMILDSLGVLRDESPCPAVPGVPAFVRQMVLGAYAQADSLNGREYMAFSNATSAHPAAGIDMPMGYDGTHCDRVSQVGPGAAPSVTDLLSGTVAITAAPNGLLIITSLVSAIVNNGDNTITHTSTGATPISLANPGDIWQLAGNADGYDGAYTVVETVSPGGVGRGSVQILSASFDISALPVNSATGGFNTQLVDIVLAAALPYVPTNRDLVVIAGATAAIYNGTWAVRAGSAGTIVVYAPVVIGAANSGGGTVGIVGHVNAGIHQLAVCFITRTQYITKPSPFTSWTSTGGKALVQGIPVGPSNVIARLLIVTPALAAGVNVAEPGPFSYLPKAVTFPNGSSYPAFIVADNTSPSCTLDFDDTTLAAGTSANYLYKLIELGECSHVISYATRTFWAGERSKIYNFNNLSFDGGFGAGGNGNVPLGWQEDAFNGAGGSRETANVWWGDAYRITGNGVTNARGVIFQGAIFDFLNVPLLGVNTAYSARVRLVKGGGILQGNAIVEVFSATAGVIGRFSTPVATIGAIYAEFIGPLITAQVSLPADAILRIYVDGIPTNGGYIIFDCLEIFPTLQPVNLNVVRASYAGDPESIDGLTGLLVIGAASGESVRCQFKLLDNKLYFVTDTGIFSTQDDGKNEPDQWVVNIVSSNVGTGSVHGVATAESWAILAYTDGAYIFWGSEPVKISQEIQPDWDTINFDFGQKIYVVIDYPRRRVHIGAPVNGNENCNLEFVMDYSQLAAADNYQSGLEIASSPQVMDTINGTIAPGKARKWTLFNLSANCAVSAQRSNGSQLMLRGNGTNTGKVYNQSAIALSDDGVAIDGEYQTHYFPTDYDSRAVGYHRMLCKYLTGYTVGSGTMATTIFRAQDQGGLALSPLTLALLAQQDWEKNVNFTGERMSLLFGTNAVGSWMNMAKLLATVQRDLMAPVRGVS